MNSRKQITYLTYLALGIALAAVGCDSDDGGNNGNAGGSTYGGSKATGGTKAAGGGAGAAGLSAGAGGTLGTGGAATAGGAAGNTSTGGLAGSSAGAAGGTAGRAGSGGAMAGTAGIAQIAGGATSVAGAGGSMAGSAGWTGGAGGTGTGGSAGGGGFAGSGGFAGAGVAGNAGSAGAGAIPMSFFVSSDTNTTGDLGGLVGADGRCQALATAVGRGAGVWHAYLSAEPNAANGYVTTNARDRIGNGPWYNANGLLVTNNLAQLHALTGDPDIFVDEHGMRINGQWAGSPTPVEHDVLTGSTTAGTVMAGFTCENWTSSSATISAQVGHTDGLGPSMNPNPPYDSWNSSHANESCANTAPRGGAGRLYCFLVN